MSRNEIISLEYRILFLKGILSQLILKFQIIKLNILLSEPRFPRHENVSVIIDILALCQFLVQFSTVISSLRKEMVVFQWNLIVLLIPDVCWHGFFSVLFEKMIKEFEPFEKYEDIDNHRSSIHRYKIKQKWSRRDDKFHDLLMSKSPVVGQVCRISHFLARYNSRYVTEKTSNDKKNHRMDYIWPDLLRNCYLWGICHSRR